MNNHQPGNLFGWKNPVCQIQSILQTERDWRGRGLTEGSGVFGVYRGARLCSSLSRIPLRKFRSIRRELSDSGRRVEDLLADGRSSKYSYGFPTGGVPTPETLTNYLDVSSTPLGLRGAGVSRSGAWRLTQLPRILVTVVS